jgi:hypothetical protein
MVFHAITLIQNIDNAVMTSIDTQYMDVVDDMRELEGIVKTFPLNDECQFAYSTLLKALYVAKGALTEVTGELSNLRSALVKLHKTL